MTIVVIYRTGLFDVIEGVREIHRHPLQEEAYILIFQGGTSRELDGVLKLEVLT